MKHSFGSTADGLVFCKRQCASESPMYFPQAWSAVSQLQTSDLIGEFWDRI